MFLSCIPNVMTNDVRINIRVKPQTRDEFHAVAYLRGAKVSGLLHQYMVKMIREEKERNLEAFEEALETIQARPSSATDDLTEEQLLASGGRVEPVEALELSSEVDAEQEQTPHAAGRPPRRRANGR